MNIVARHLFLALAVALSLIVVPAGANAATAGVAGSAAVTSVAPADGAVVGIAHPVTVRFSDPVTDRARAEKTLSVTADRPLPGTYSWHGDRELTWTPSGFLPANTTFTVNFGDQRTQFQTNGGVVADANMSTHTFTVSIGGHVVRTMPASMGKPGFETPTGTYPVLEKFRNLIFDSRTIGIPLDSPEGYLIDGEWAVRLTWGGVFVHSAPWSVGQQGNSNVSHGCINLAPGDAAWYYENVGIGDPVNIHW
ncbi:L,D-transpeptidase [Nocardia carnea]|uniref:L,D-transpeptidase family protein n=1 Tax=Nocardia carnea TaxID=37328 RepID=A0ABW7TG08_9NOCA|nr:L,D-transpeptidase [Nocardia carnea]